jgi:predicted nucleotidyltransferase
VKAAALLVPPLSRYICDGNELVGIIAASQDTALVAIDAKLIERVTQTIVERFHPRRIVLFGSHARGDAGPDSDLDLFIEMDTRLNPYARAMAVDDAFGFRDWPMDLIIYTPEEVVRWRGQVGTMLYTIENEGRVLYECNEPAIATSRMAAKGRA